MQPKISEKADKPRLAWRFLIYVWHRFQEDRLLRVAASLSYTSLLALVPLLAISFAALAAFPVFESVRGQLQVYVLENFLPDTGWAINDYLDSFLANTGSLTAVGIVGLVVTAVLLLNTIEGAFNIVFRVARKRPLASRLLVSWAFLTLGPLLLGASLSLSTVLFTATEFLGFDFLQGAWGLVARVLPTILVITALSLFYFLIPNRSIRFWDAVIGALLAGLLFAGLRKAFGLYVAGGSAYQTIYGAAAALPVFLVWMYLTWTVVLLSAEMTASIDDWRHNRTTKAGRIDFADGRGDRIEAALMILKLLIRTSRGTGGAVSSKRLDRALSGQMDVTGLLELLAKAGMIAETMGEGWVIARDPAVVTLYDLCQAIDVTRDRPDFRVRAVKGRPAWHESLAQIFENAENARFAEMDLPLDELLAGNETARPDDVEPRGVIRKI